VTFATVVSLSLHLFMLNAAINSDEVFYVTGALTIMNHTSCGSAGTLASLQPCNLEHPPFAKLLMAMSMSAFGDGNLGVRLPSILSGVFSIPAIAWLSSSLSGGNRKAIVAASVLLSTSPTWFIMSSVGMLDSVELFFGILALAVYFSKVGQSRGGLVLSGVLMGLSILSKEEGALMLLGLLIYELILGKPKRIFYVAVSSIVTILGVLWTYDLALTPFTNPLQHIQFIIDTSIRLRYQGGYLLTPLQWFFQPRETLLAVVALVWVPVSLVWVFRKGRAAAGLSSFSLVLLAATLVPLVILYYINQRQEYLFYEFQVVSALALGTSGLLGKRGPWVVVIVIMFVATFIFAYYFPLLRSIYIS